MRRAAALLGLVLALPAAAIERIRVRAAEVSAAGASARQVEALLAIHDAERSTLTVRAARVTPPAAVAAQTGAVTDVRLRCANPLVAEPRFGCPALSVALASARAGALRWEGRVRLDSDSGAFVVAGAGPTFGGITPQATLTGTVDRFVADITLPPLSPQVVRGWLAPHVDLPEGLELSGRIDGAARLTRDAGGLAATARFALADGGFQNADFTWIGEKLALVVEAEATLADTAAAETVPFTLRLHGERGQALTGPALFDFDRHPLALAVSGHTDGQRVVLARIDGSQRDLAGWSGSAALTLAPLAVDTADVAFNGLTFPGLYASYLQLPLATTPFNQLVTRGSASARIAVRAGLPTEFDLAVQDLGFRDDSRALAVEGVNGELHWRADVIDARASWLAWETSRGWGIEGARTRLDFLVAGRDFQLLQPARLPFFDGALLVRRFAVENVGRLDLSGEFDAVVEPISVGPIAKALGWPEFAGKLSGSIPGLTYRDRVLSLAGNLEAQVFDGRVTASNLRVRDPLSDFPRVLGDVVARNLDLDLITRTFEFGSITGRLDADLLGLETFGRAPVAFDLSLRTPPGDRSRRRISQRAVQNISDIGGSGGGVAAALQSGALKFFDDFGYDRLGLSCRLRNDVCQMGGAGNAGSGFYIVKGKGLPRIDIIGNNRRVDWPLLMQQVSDALDDPSGIAVQ